MKVLVSIVLFLFIFSSANALSLSLSQSDFSCGTYVVTATYDCGFDGTAIVSISGGVMLQGSNVKTITNGVFDFEILVLPGNNINFSISTNVIGSNNACTDSPNNMASASMTHSCILPPNDICADAITLLVNSAPCTADAFTTDNTSDALIVPACTVAGFKDLWYDFTPSSTKVNIHMSSIPGSFARYAVYSDCLGADIACGLILAGLGDVQISSLNMGSEYRLQIMFLSTATGTDQEICLYTPPPSTTVPLEVLNITSKSDQGQVKIQLETTSEFNVDKIVLQRLVDENWKDIKAQKATNTLDYASYNFIDYPENNGEFFYRFAIIDYDERIEYSKIFSQYMNQSKQVSIQAFPNPSYDSWTISNLPQSNKSIELINMNGELVKSYININSSTFKMQNLDLTEGVYLIRVSSENYLQSLLVSKVDQ